MTLTPTDQAELFYVRLMHARAADLTDAEFRCYAALAVWDVDGEGCNPNQGVNAFTKLIAVTMNYCPVAKAERCITGLTAKGLVELRNNTFFLHPGVEENAA